MAKPCPTGMAVFLFIAEIFPYLTPNTKTIPSGNKPLPSKFITPPMPSTRLAAIMFTDIVGYTAMMQEDREKAMTAIRQFEDVLRNKLNQRQGELLQTYGDGSLSIFDSGRNYWEISYDYEYAFRPLWEYQPFVEKFVKPKG